MAQLHNYNYYYDIVRKNIKKYRNDKGYTQKELSEMANISEDYLCEIESMKRQKSFSIDVLGKIADSLDVDISEFFKK